MNRAAKKACLGCFVLLVLDLVVLAALYVGGNARAGSKLDELASRAAAEIEKERAASPVPRERPTFAEPLHDDAAPRYQRVLRALATISAVTTSWDKAPADGDEVAVAALLARTLDDRAFAPEGETRRRADRFFGSVTTGAISTQIVPDRPLPAATALGLAGLRPVVAPLRDAVRCDRCDWKLDLTEEGKGDEIPVTWRASGLFAGLAHERAAAGDARGAVELLLEQARFGADVRASGRLGHATSGETIASEAFRRLSLLLPWARARGVSLADLERDLGRIEALFPPPNDAFRFARLAVPGTIRRRVDEFSDSGPLLFRRLAAPPQIEKAQSLWAELEREGSIRPDEARKLAQDTTESKLRDDRFLPLQFLWYLDTYAWGTWDRWRVAIGLLRGVIAVEKLRAAGLPLPEDGASLGLREDPFSCPPAPLRFRRAGEGYRIWSVGSNAKDDGGERKKAGQDDIAIDIK